MDYMSDALCCNLTMRVMLHLYIFALPWYMTHDKDFFVRCWIAFREINCLLKSFSKLLNRMYHELNCIMWGKKGEQCLWKIANYGLQVNKFCNSVNYIKLAAPQRTSNKTELNSNTFSLNAHKSWLVIFIFIQCQFSC